jgi:hypothetical protein
MGGGTASADLAGTVIDAGPLAGRPPGAPGPPAPPGQEIRR